MNSEFFMENENSMKDHQEFNILLDKYNNACEVGEEDELDLSENEFDVLLEYFMNTDANTDDELLKCSKLAYTKHPYSSSLLLKYCDSLIAFDNPKKAIDLLLLQKDYFSENYTIDLMMARAHIRVGDYEYARELVENISHTSEYDEMDCDFMYNIAQDCIDCKKYNEALFYLEKCVVFDKKEFIYYTDIAFCYDKLDDINRAKEYYVMYLDNDPFNDNIWFNLGTTYAKNQEHELAVEAFEYSLALNENNDSSLYNLAIVYLNLGQYVKSILLFEKCLKFDDSSTQALIGIGNSYLGLTEMGSAKIFYKKAMEADSNCVEAALALNSMSLIEEYLRYKNIEDFRNKILPLDTEEIEWLITFCTGYKELIDDLDFLNALAEVKNR